MEVISTRMTRNLVTPASQVLANASRMMGHKALGLLVRHHNCAMRVKTRYVMARARLQPQGPQ